MKAIVAMTADNGIGKDGDLLVRLSPDLKRFKALTLGQVVIYGRKTMATFPKGRPLPGRLNIVLTRHTALEPQDNLIVVSSLNELHTCLASLRRQGVDDDAFIVIGGASVYRALHEEVDDLLVTRLLGSYEADTYYPDVASDPAWRLIERCEPQDDHGVTFAYEHWRRAARHVTYAPLRLADLKRLTAAFHERWTASRVTPYRRWCSRSADDRAMRAYSVTSGTTVIGVATAQATPPGSAVRTLAVDCDHALDDDACLALGRRLLADDGDANDVLLTLPTRRLASATPSCWTTSPHASQALRLMTRLRDGRPALAFVPILGSLLIVASDDDCVREATFLSPGEMSPHRTVAQALSDCGLLDAYGRLMRCPTDAITVQVTEAQTRALAWLDAYLRNDASVPRPLLDETRLTPFTRRVFSVLATVERGQSISYRALAARVVGEAKARRYARAVGAALAANPFALFVPCHRVVGADGSLVGFSAGLSVKDRLLTFELMSRIAH